MKSYIGITDKTLNITDNKDCLPPDIKAYFEYESLDIH